MSTWKKELWNAIGPNNIIDFDRILSRSDVKTEIKDIDEWKWYEDPLHQAALKGRDEMLTKLLDAGAKVNAYSYSDDRKCQRTALHLASLNNRNSCVKLLMRNGADANMQGKSKTLYILCENICKAIIFCCLIDSVYGARQKCRQKNVDGKNVERNKCKRKKCRS